VSSRDELGELRRIAALARGYLREQHEGTRVEEHAYRVRLVAALVRLEESEFVLELPPPTVLRRMVDELGAQVCELEAALEL